MRTSDVIGAKSSGKTPGRVAGDIMEFARQMGEGNPFWTRELLHLGKRSALSRALSGLVREEKLMRVMRGLYVLPEISELFGRRVPASTGSVMDAISRLTGEVFEVSPEVALSALRLTTQNQMRETYCTTGRPRVLRIGKRQPIYLKSTPRKKAIAPIMGSLAGAAAIALLYLGPGDVDEDIMKTVKKNMPPEEFDRLVSVAPKMPRWLADILLRNKYRASIAHRTTVHQENPL